MNATLNAPLTPERFVSPTERLRCLWISRDIPFPQDAGDRIYSGNLAAALARADVDVCFVGYLQQGVTALPHNWVNQWLTVEGNKRDQNVALLSRYPRIAAMHATASYQKLLEQQLQQHWDAVVLDGYACGWALPQCLKTRSETAAPLIVYVSHNHEESLWRDMFRALPVTSPKRLAVWQNYLKVRRTEQDLIEHADLISTITQEDAQTYATQRRHLKRRQPSIDPLVLTPGYLGYRKHSRQLTKDTPRHVVVMGSFRWVVKQENLRRLIAAADAIFAQHGIVLDIIGDVPQELLRDLSSKVSATRFHGFVADVSSLLDKARLALVPEVVGGGFKLKFLDYVFGRVPIAAIATATSGIPASLLRHMIRCDDLEALVQTVVRDINNLDRLNLLQNEAYREAEPLFDWDVRGRQLAVAIQAMRSSHA